ncbi:MAG TPA: glycosyltransferase family 9 protein, partial [Candidatus Marinimicrobia bacterium]|nr:glycosyltransferase family 9 protein [Candidatus Neomarinimicrobiota bacterium]
MKIGVYSPNWIGDAVMALPFIHHLKEKNPESKIIIICRDWVAAVYENHPEIDQIITLSRSDIKGFFAIRRIGKSFQLLDLDVFYTLTDSFRSAAILGWSNAKIRIGFKSQMRSIFLTDAIENPKKKMHRSIKYLTLISFKIKADNSIGIKLTSGEIQWAKEELKNMKLELPMALFPFSVASSRSIPNNKIKEWLNGSNQSVIILGSKEDATLANSLIDECAGIKLINLCGKYSMRESMALISVCQFALASD